VPETGRAKLTPKTWTANGTVVTSGRLTDGDSLMFRCVDSQISHLSFQRDFASQFPKRFRISVSKEVPLYFAPVQSEFADCSEVAGVGRYPHQRRVGYCEAVFLFPRTKNWILES
jgi:hypothetical protein